jgi:hypothetical protein
MTSSRENYSHRTSQTCERQVQHFDPTRSQKTRSINRSRVRDVVPSVVTLRNAGSFDCVRLAPHFAQDDIALKNTQQAFLPPLRSASE